ncbi:MAG: SDR family oxidoreductase [Gracilibacteraceae bacterium]|jgi:NADP-dependent 3-hydroxy acid dehydrogenase YdfG|nr:SDR family oxidoreductase [Gracilibacteraceae bacterium]
MNPEYFSYFKDKVGAVTGASSGIGLGYAKYMLAAGAKAVFLCARGKDRLEKEGGYLAERYPGKVFWETIDVTDKKQVEKFVDGAWSKYEQLDLLFNNAGISHLCSVWEVDDKLWEDLFNTNFWSVKYGVFAAIKHMLQQKTGGHIVNTASISGLVPYPYQAAYCPSKFAAVGFSRSMRYEFYEDNIKISCVCPPLVDTTMVRETGMPLPDDVLSVEDAVDYIMKGIAENHDLICFDYMERLKNLLDHVMETDGALLDNALARRKHMDAVGSPWNR